MTVDAKIDGREENTGLFTGQKKHFVESGQFNNDELDDEISIKAFLTDLSLGQLFADMIFSRFKAKPRKEKPNATVSNALANLFGFKAVE